ncbi:MAG TPA: bifunctional glycosyltransferase family 2/GtrA family protein [Jatrophihabitans sp.]|nr:bifunctional glycosyltransferase family 2/GtrA family protein [Jatrophihabitans sp.]
MTPLARTDPALAGSPGVPVLDSNALPGKVNADHPAERVVLDVTVPVYDEERDLAGCVRRLHRHLTEQLPYRCTITIADNASTDATPRIARALAAELPDVRYLRLEQKGRGRALSAVWQSSAADVVAYLDVDMSTDLNALLPLVAPLISGHSDLAIGSRLSRHSRVVRGTKRELISRCYNLLLRSTLLTRFSDAQCGFKALRTEVARKLLPLVEDTGWFFDTELLVLAERAGLRIHEVPVDWVDDPDSRVDIMATALADLRGVARVGRALATGRLPLAEIRAQLGRHPLTPSTPDVPAGLFRQLVRFAAIGLLSTAAYLLLFLLAHPAFGAQGANLFALLVTALANTAANRRLTFGISGRRHYGRHQLQGLVVFVLGLALTSGSLAALHAAEPTPHRMLELAVLIGANLVATALRFVLLRGWVFGDRPGSRPAETPA